MVMPSGAYEGSSESDLRTTTPGQGDRGTPSAATATDRWEPPNDDWSQVAIDDGSSPSHLQPEFRKMLDSAATRGTSELVDAIRTGIAAGDGRDVFLQVILLTWAIRRDPRRLDELGHEIATASDPDLCWALILSVGRAGTPEARTALMRWIDSAQFQKMQEGLLRALNVLPMTSEHQLASAYSDYLESLPEEDGHWPIFLTAQVHASRDPEVVNVTARHLSDEFPPHIRKRAARILADLADTTCRDKPVLDAQTSITLRKHFIQLLSERDPALRAAAADYLRAEDDPAVAAVLWDALNRSATDDPARGKLAEAVAAHARSEAEVVRVIDALRREPLSAVRLDMLTGIEFSDRMTESDRLSAVRVLTSWAKGEPDVMLREQAVYKLRKMLSAAPDCLAWALQDPDPRIRELAGRLAQETMGKQSAKEEFLNQVREERPPAEEPSDSAR